MNLLQVTLDFSQQAAGNLPGVTASSASNPNAAFGTFLSATLTAIMVIALLVVLIFLLWGALDWISSGGEKSKIESARQKMTTAIIGLIVLASSLAVFGILQRFLGVSFFRVGSSGLNPTDVKTNSIPQNGGQAAPDLFNRIDDL